MRFLRKLAAEEGASAVISALLLSTLLIMASLTIDIGMTYADASAIQNVADALLSHWGAVCRWRTTRRPYEVIAKADE